MRLSALALSFSRLGSVGGRSLLLCAIVASTTNLAGCGSFVPPPPPELDAIADSREVPTIKVELVLAGPDVDDRIAWKQAARLEAANAKSILTVSQLEEGDPPAKVADLIRKAIDRDVNALVVEPVDVPELAPAVNEARAKGIAVIVMDRKIPGPDSSKSYPSVVYSSIDQPARQMAEGALKRAVADGLPADGKGLILVNTRYGPDTEGRVEILIKALKEAGVADVERLDFQGDYAVADTNLRAKLEADPKITIVLAHEEQGLSGAVTVRQALKSTRKFEVAGTVSIDRVMGGNVLTVCSGLIDRNINNLVRQSLKTAVLVAKGQNPAEEVLVPLPYHELTPSDKAVEEQESAANSGPKSPEFDREKRPRE